ncbi:MAG: hypothetical protein LBJ67_10645 [Planctomycetaceae bacterium]|jgi:hypothetical protein|nr:hypothetical protein [Planctomycetaceae bacterium]
MSSIPSPHFSDEPPFDMDYDPNDDSVSDWSPTFDVVETGTQTLAQSARASQKSVRRQENDFVSDIEGDEETIDAEVLQSPVVVEVSNDFIASWNRLISMTNWEKGKLIFLWRAKLAENNLPRQVYSDESLAKRIGSVSGQHIGRLRRVYERFGETFTQYTGLFWSHFQAVLDWDDAENWLTDASGNQWSVATMRLKRWEAIGSPAGQKPRDSEIIMSEQDEDVNTYNDSDTVLDGNLKSVEPNRKNKNKDHDKDRKKHSNNGSGDSRADNFSANSLGEFSSPAEAFAQMKQMKDLPEDLKEAFEQLKIVILSHKVSGWREVDPQRILTFLNAMKVVVITEEK